LESVDLTDIVDNFVHAMARYYKAQNDTYFISILASAKSKLKITGDELGQVESELLKVGKRIWLSLDCGHAETLSEVVISPQMSETPDWQIAAFEWINGKGVTNQGRVRSNNIASRQWDGLLFRSQPEILLYKAIKSLGVSFAPLPVVLRGGDEYKRIEPDFVIFYDGMFIIVEVDGDTFHEESPAEAQARTTLLEDEGAYIIHKSASECDTQAKAKVCAQDILDKIKKQRSSRS